MDKKGKLQTFYFMVILSLILLSSVVYFIMEKIENHTTMLENHVHKRHLGYIVDKDYKLEVSKKKDETVHFLNSLTDFFEIFHDQTVYYKKQLETFMKKRKNVIKRFNDSSINIYDLTVVPNQGSTYHFQPRSKQEMNNYQKQLSRNFRQVPFSRILKFKVKDKSKIKNNTYLLCNARIQAKSDKLVNIQLAIVSNQEKVSDDMFVDYTIKNQQTTLNLNRIIKITNVKKANVKIIGTSKEEFEVIKVGAYCLNFNDIGNQEEQ